MQLKHRWSIANNYLAGITAGMWWRLLRENHFAVSPAYAHRALAISLLSLGNSLAAAVEHARFGAAIAAQPVEHPPVFILGHWRSGTTHLHNLLALDSGQFAYPNTYQVVNPFTFLTTESLNTRLFGWMVPKTRPMDNMAMSFAAAQEDELALCLACLKSHYLAISFPRSDARYAKYLTFRGEPEAARQWQAALKWFVRKLTLKHRKAIVLKSPPHTARVRLILEAFPDARFIHIHRDPYTVFRSSQHYFDTATWYTYLQRPDRSLVDGQILQRYAELHDAYFEERDLIPPGQIHELSFTELEQDPVGQVRTIYGKLGLDSFEAFEPKLREHVATLEGYRKNRHADLPAELRQRINTAWRRSFEAWGYEMIP